MGPKAACGSRSTSGPPSCSCRVTAAIMPTAVCQASKAGCPADNAMASETADRVALETAIRSSCVLPRGQGSSDHASAAAAGPCSSLLSAAGLVAAAVI